MAIKTKVHGTGGQKLRSSFAGQSAGRPSSKDIVRHHKAANIKDLGYTNFSTDRPGKVSIKGGQK